MVVGVSEIGLKEVVIHVGDGKLRTNPRKADGLELKIGHRARGVLSKGLVDLDGDGRAALKRPGDQMSFDQLFGNGEAHVFLLLV